MGAADKCLPAMNAAMGRDLTPEEVQQIREAIQKHERLIWNEDPAKARQMGRDALMAEAGRRAAEDLVHQAQLKRYRTALTITKHEQLKTFMEEKGHTFTALNDINAFSAQGGAGRTSVEYTGRAISNMAIGQMEELVRASKGRFLGFVQNREDVRQFLKAVWGEPVDNEAMGRVGKAWLKVTAELRDRFNRAGGDVGDLGEKWHIPQHHDQLRIAKVGPDRWIADILPKLDRREYVNPDGTLMNNQQMVQFLGHAYDTISTGGTSKMEPGKVAGNGMRANRNAAQRQLFFRDADSYLAYHDAYGNKDIYNVLFDHLHSLGRDIALLETWGPNPDLQFRFWKETVLQQQTADNRTQAAAVKGRAWYADALYREVAGLNGAVPGSGIANFLHNLRSWLVASRLGSAIISSFADEATMRCTAHLWDIPEMTLMRHELRAMNPANKEELRLLRRAGLAINTFSAELNRFGSGFGTVPDKIAAAVIRASGLNAITDARKRAFGASMMNVLADLTREKDFAALAADDHRLLTWKGIDENTWKVWQAAEAEQWGDGLHALTPEAIRAIPDEKLAALGGDAERLRQEAATKLVATVLEETDTAVIEPGARERAFLYAGTTKGTTNGEILRSLMQFKMFSFSMISKHWQRAMSLPGWQSKAGYTAALVVASTIMGAVSLEISELLSGRDPRKLADPNDPVGTAKTWLAAALKGGSLGIYGDFLFSPQTRYGGSMLATAAGPTAGAVDDFLNLTIGNAHQAAAGQRTDFGAETLRFARGMVPGSSLWYAKAAFDHLVVNDLQEYLSPGYLERMQERSRQDFGQQYWWTPGQALPQRGPDLSQITGG